MEDKKEIPEREKWIYESRDGRESVVESIKRGIAQAEAGQLVSIDIEDNTNCGGNPMGQYGAQSLREVIIAVSEDGKVVSMSALLKVGDDLVIPYREAEIKRITLPPCLFSPSGKGVSERTSREKDGRLVRSATAFFKGTGDIIVLGVDGKETRIACTVS